MFRIVSANGGVHDAIVNVSEEAFAIDQMHGADTVDVGTWDDDVGHAASSTGAASISIEHRHIL